MKIILSTLSLLLSLQTFAATKITCSFHYDKTDKSVALIELKTSKSGLLSVLWDSKSRETSTLEQEPNLVLNLGNTRQKDQVRFYTSGVEQGMDGYVVYLPKNFMALTTFPGVLRQIDDGTGAEGDDYRGQLALDPINMTCKK